MNVYLLIVMLLIVIENILNFSADYLNIKHIKTEVPEAFREYLDEQKYKKQQLYLKDKTIFSWVQQTAHLVLLIPFIVFGGFNLIDTMVRRSGFGDWGNGLLFFLSLYLISMILSLPFSTYYTFVLEEKYGFNKTTLQTFVSDIFKGLGLTLVLGGFVAAVVLWLFMTLGPYAPLVCWIFLSVFQLLMMFVYPVFIIPLFNKMVPLEEGELKEAIHQFAESEAFPLKGVYKMDGSKRSTKGNAFFTGFGKTRCIALFDTLIEKHSTDELLVILAHEIGHYKKHHIFKMIALSLLSSAFMLYILSLFIENEGLHQAFQMENVSVYASLVFVSFLYSPVSVLFSIITNKISRKHEYEADAFAEEKYSRKGVLAQALIKLSIDNFSNLSPHPLYVLLNYSHPPVLSRLKQLERPDLGL